ncbi:SH3 domain-containing protein [Balneola sp. MJW-20]|uniref:SH3 domain-containing protein n=1 Tax=Gracilimonas aurantiaca TaxID=3234185 RepID=UPI003466D90D
MKKILLLILMVSFSAACSTTSWVVINEDEIDYQDFELLDSDFFLESSNNISANQPGITFTLKTANTYEYAQRIKTERYIQRYKPRTGYVIVGLMGASLATYAAYSDQLIQQPSNSQKATLLSAGALMTGISLLNMKENGAPTKTGETKLLRKSGSIVMKDTALAKPYLTEKPMVRITFDGSLLVEEQQREFSDNQIFINLAEELDPEFFPTEPVHPVRISASYGEDTTTVDIPVSSIFEKFAIVTNSVTPLRNEPSTDDSSILTELASGSQLKYVSQDSNWVRVLYGISETFISTDDVEIIWRPSAFASDLSVITVPNVPFGSVDVERNLRLIRNGRSTAHKGVIISNSNYESPIHPKRIYGERDLRLVQELYKQSLNITESDILTFQDINNEASFSKISTDLNDQIADRDSVLILYISGYAEVIDSELYFIGTSDRNDQRSVLPLSDLFVSLAELNIEQIHVIADLDIISPLPQNEVLSLLSQKITEKKVNSVVLFSSGTDQRSGWYSSSNGEQNRHSIFTYYFAKGLKEGISRYNSLYNYLERNVPFTSRSIYDRPQNVLIYGNNRLDLAK